MTLPAWLKTVLPPDTATTWETIAPVIPSTFYLVGGTAVSIHLRHRVSRDLDFFYHDAAIDLDKLAAALSELGPFAITLRSPGTLNGVFSDTRLQFLHAAEQCLLEKPTVVEGLRVAGISDLMAMKLKVIGQRGEARDYFDAMTIEERTGLRAEEGLGLYLARFNVPADQAAASIDPIVLGLGYFGDVEEDEALPIPLAEIARYWTQRQPEVIAYTDRFGAAAVPQPQLSAPRATGRIHVKAYRRTDGTQVHEHYRDR